MLEIKGLHHISSMVKHAQENVDFYTNVLGLRLVKKTLNYDDQDGYHFYFSNSDATAALSTFFPMSDVVEGAVGGGQVSVTRYAIPNGTFDFWTKQLEKYKVFYYTYERFGKKIIAFTDPHGLELELVEDNQGIEHSWQFNHIKKEDAITGIASTILLSKKPEETLNLFQNIFGYKITNEDNELWELTLNDDIGSIVHLNKHLAERGKPGTGTVHHIALKVANDEIDAWQKNLIEYGYRPTEVKDRNYFKSVYFRETGGILIELATEGPGVTIDETLEELGTHFIIPKHYRENEAIIKSAMMPIVVKEMEQLRSYNYRNKYEYEIATQKEAILEQINELSNFAKDRDLTDTEQNTLKELRAKFINTK